MLCWGNFVVKMLDSTISTNSSMEESGADDSRWLWRVHTTVLSGWPVWPLVLHQLVMACNRRTYLEDCMAHVDFIALPVELPSGGGMVP